MKLNLFPFVLLILIGNISNAKAIETKKTETDAIIKESKSSQFLNQKNLVFTENRGQINNSNSEENSNVLYSANSESTRIYLNKNGISYQFNSIKKNSAKNNYSIFRLDMELLGANKNAIVESNEQTEYTENFYTPNNPNGILNVPTYKKIIYRNIYPSIDWVIYSVNNTMKYDFIVHPGGNPNIIKLKYTNSDSVDLMKDGSITIKTALGFITEAAPFTFQSSNEIKSKFRINNKNIISFEISNYDKSQDLTIDPAIIWSTYYGGSGIEIGNSLISDPSGNIFMCGKTNSTANISSSGFQNTNGGGYDAFVVKFSNSGSRLWASYYGGAGDDEATSIAIDASGNIFFAGITTSTSGISSGGFQNTFGGGTTDGFLVKMNSSGLRSWASYYGGGLTDFIEGIAIDGSGNIFTSGTTSSWSGIASGGFQNTYSNSFDAFLVKFNNNGVRLWGTYYGGTGWEECRSSVNIDNNGNIYLSGFTNSTSGISNSGFQNTLGGGFDAFLVKFNSSGARAWATYYGGAGNDYNEAKIGIDANGFLYLSGFYTSLSSISSNGFQNFNGGSYDAFLVKFNSSGGRIWGTFVGGTGDELNIRGPIIDGSGNVIIAGNTNSNANIAYNGFKNNWSGSDETFAVKFDGNGNRLWGTYFGFRTTTKGLAIDQNGNLYISGQTNSSSSISSNGFQNSFGGNYDAFLVKICDLPLGTPGKITGPSSTCIGATYTYSITPSSGITGYTWNVPFGSTITSGQSSYSINVKIGFSSGYISAQPYNSCVTGKLDSFAITAYSYPSVPTINPMSSLSFCQGDSVKLISSAITGNTWSNSATNQAITVKSSGSYSVSVSNNGCSKTSSSINVLVNPNPNKPNLASNSPVTSGASIKLTASTIANATYNWSGPLNYSSNLQNPTVPSATSSNIGYYKTYVIDNNLCRSLADSTFVNITTPSNVFTLYFDTVSSYTGQQVLITCKVKNFKNIVSGQSTINFNPQMLSFVKVEQFNLTYLSASSFGVSQANQGRLTFSWTDPTLKGITISNGTAIFKIRLSILSGNQGKICKINFDNTPVIKEFSDISLTPFSIYGLLPGQVNISSDAVISGKIVTELNSGVRSCTVFGAGINNRTTMGSSKGYYWIPLTNASPYTLSPSKNNDTLKNNGITTADALLIQRHIIGTQLLASPYKIIAADANSSSSVTTIDIANINAMILGNTTTFPGNKLWNFVPSNYKFSSNSNPFPYPNVIYYQSTSDQINQDFIGMRIGDVNNSYNANTPILQTFVDSIRFYTESKIVTQNSNIKVAVKTKRFKNISGLQFTIQWDTTVLKLLNLTDGKIVCNRGENQIGSGKLFLNWIEPNGSFLTLKDNDTIINLNFQAIGSKGSSSLVEITSSNTTPIEVSDKDLNLLEVKTGNGRITIQNNNSPIIENKYLTNIIISPNPFTSSTTIKFLEPSEEIYAINISDVNGKTIEVKYFKISEIENSIEIGNSLSKGQYNIIIYDSQNNVIASKKVIKI